MKKTWVALLALLSMTSLANADWTVSDGKKDITVSGDIPTEYHDAVNKASVASGEPGKKDIGFSAFDYEEYRVDPTGWQAANEARNQNYGRFTLKDSKLLATHPLLTQEILRNWIMQDAKKSHR